MCCGDIIPEGRQICISCENYRSTAGNMDKCGTCKYYIGGGDWGLCCDLQYGLCYRYTAACHKYKFSQETIDRLKEQDEQLDEYIRNAGKETE